jgi:hypothetical protein
VAFRVAGYLDTAIRKIEALAQGMNLAQVIVNLCASEQ